MHRVDDDPDGEKLVQIPDPLSEASKMIKKLTNGNPSNIKGFIWAYNVDVRRGKLLLAIQDIIHAISIAGKSDPDVHECIIDLNLRVTNSNSFEKRDCGSQNDTVENIVSEKLASMLDGKPLEEYHNAWKQANKGSFKCRAIACKLSSLLHVKTAAANVSEFIELERAYGLSNSDHTDCVDFAKWIKEVVHEDPKLFNSFKEFCATQFKWSRYFGGPKCVDVSGLESDLQSLKIT